MFASLLKFDPSQPRDEQGQWKKIGTGLDRLMKRFGADWLNVMAILDKEGALSEVLNGRLDLEKLAKTPALRAILKFDPALHPRDKEGQFAETGTPGQKFAGRKIDPKNIAGQMLDRAMGLNRREHEDYQPIKLTDDPRKTRFLLPDGTRITSPVSSKEHSDILFEGLMQEGKGFPPSLGEVMAAGIVRFSAGQMGGVEIKAPLTKAQAQVIVDDFNIAFQSPFVRVDMTPEGPQNWNVYETGNFPTPVNAEKLRHWSEQSFKKLNSTAKFDPTQPRDEKGRWSFWHGTPSGDMRGGTTGLHIGTHEAARQALNARIGIPATGEWDGTRVYGKTKLAGRKTLTQLDPKGYNQTGQNASPPEEDYYPKGEATYSDGTKVPMNAKPDIFQVELIGPMANSPTSPREDFKVNSLMQGLLKRGNAKRGYFYRQEGEDVGSISAVVPSQDYIRRLKFDPTLHPRGEGGRWIKVGTQMAALKAKYPDVAKNYPRSTYTEMGSIESHTSDVGREWETQISNEELDAIGERFGSDVQKLMATAIPLHDIGKAEAVEEGEGKSHQHEHTIPILQKVLREEGFKEKDIALATELMGHDLIGPLFRGYGDETDVTVAAKLVEKAKKVGMNVQDFARLQLAFYQADAAAYPYITQYMDQEPSGKWTFTGRKQIAAIEALTRQSVAKFAGILKYDPAQRRDEHTGRWVSVYGESDPMASEAEPDSNDLEAKQVAHDTHVAIEQYTEGNASYMNGTLRAAGQRSRGITPTGPYRQFPVNTQQMELLDEHMAKNLLPADTTLTRTVHTFVMNGLNVGDVYQDDGYVSTTRDPEMLPTIRQNIGARMEEYQSVLTIHAPKGLGHIDVNQELGEHLYQHQKEVILPRGLKYQIVSKTGNAMTVKVLQ